MANSVAQFDALSAEADFLFVVFYRGHWCPFCMSYLRDFEKLIPEINRAHGKGVIVTAEPEVHLSKTLAKTHFSGDVILDPDLHLVNNLRSRSLVDVAVTEKSSYPNGMIQPAVLVTTKDGKALYSWAIKPGLMNLGGAKDRVALNEVWQDVQALQSGSVDQPRQNYTKQSLATGLKFAMFG